MTTETGVLRVPVLLYHSVRSAGRASGDGWQVDVAAFAADMEAVAASGRQAMTATRYAKWLAGEEPAPAQPVLVTFDDGYADVVDAALPILDRLGIVATVFVTSGWIGRPGMLSRRALADLASHGGFEIGAHSVSHPHLDLLDDRSAYQEISGSRRWLEDHTGEAVRSFAYPHGSHHAGTRAAVVSAGYQTAHAVKNAVSHAADDPFAVARYTVRADTPRARVAAVLRGGGAPLAWRRERLRTRGFRVVRALRQRISP